MGATKSIEKFFPLTVSLTAALIPLAAAIFTSSANAAQWVRIVTDNNAAFYIDASSIRGRGRYRYYWQLVAFQKPQTFRAGMNRASAPVYGYAIYTSIDCRSKIGRVRRILALDRNNRTLMEINMNDFGPEENMNSAGLPTRYAAAYACRSNSRR